ncbi:efflux RND transporter periplasmic adaptor subunit [Nitrosomonas sp.]|uniref:efflux RND transporter periplasmic adaptor subunit n=1 Tax=Nitrosomonas sp. TaxID=42353 RepID=UPI0025D843E0|nr:efflux RND transporter periplasmic adaptor subunit [Nitrosomonas sp.]MCC6916849.1 efflux RND transporter periplasmic adaptor subunit [Nitrosomonas sp.]
MKFPPLQRRTLALLTVITLLLTLFVYIALQSGPLAPVAVTVTTVKSRSIIPALSGIGTVQARYTYKIGPVLAGRVKHLNADVGDMVQAGQTLGEMDPVDLDDRIRAQEAAIKSAEADLHQAQARQHHAQAQLKRYEKLLPARGTSEESVAIKREELAVTKAATVAARENLGRAHADLQALHTQRGDLRLVTPVTGLVTRRAVDPGTTLVTGQPAVEVIDTAHLWIDTRFDQINAQGLAPGLPAQFILRSQQTQSIAGHVLRVEPLADTVTEETLAKIIFTMPPSPLPPVGELAEVTVYLPELPAAPAIPNAAIHIRDGVPGVWKLVDGKPEFARIEPGQTDLDGHIQIRHGLEVGDQLIVHSEKMLTALSRIRIEKQIPGVAP